MSKSQTGKPPYKERGNGIRERKKKWRDDRFKTCTDRCTQFMISTHQKDQLFGCFLFQKRVCLLDFIYPCLFAVFCFLFFFFFFFFFFSFFCSFFLSYFPPASTESNIHFSFPFALQMILFFVFLSLSFSAPITKINIDGNFNDWNSVKKRSDPFRSTQNSPIAYDGVPAAPDVHDTTSTAGILVLL